MSSLMDDAASFWANLRLEPTELEPDPRVARFLEHLAAPLGTRFVYATFRATATTDVHADAGRCFWYLGERFFRRPEVQRHLGVEVPPGVDVELRPEVWSELPGALCSSLADDAFVARPDRPWVRFGVVVDACRAWLGEDLAGAAAVSGDAWCSFFDGDLACTVVVYRPDLHLVHVLLATRSF
ncbi:MAG: hypothetical protein H6738_23825 [Alphaproteobacteria bacterium]|nr:hypothetical protein [Alphaproteobacteria bacterium]